MTQAAKLSSTPQTEGSHSVLTAASVDDPPPGSDIPPQCSLQWDALQEAGRGVDAAVAILEERAIAMRDCVLSLNKPVQPWPAPAPGGEYVNVSGAPASPASVMSYKRRQIDETIGLIAGVRRRLKDLLRTP
jgi:hypothetical protein